MKTTVEQLNDWKCALKMARFTVNKDYTGNAPSLKWRKFMLLSEHSPIREVRYLIQWYGIMTWVAQHLSRHDFGGEHHAMDCAAVQYGATQRSDRTGVDREDRKQTDLTNHAMTCNAQDLINMSRKRLCTTSAKETIYAWKSAKQQIALIDPEMASVMVPECVYRGFCPKSCGFNKTEKYLVMLDEYSKLPLRNDTTQK